MKQKLLKKERTKEIILSQFLGLIRTQKVGLAYRQTHKECVSRTTIIKAFNELRDAGLVVRGWGKGRNARWKVVSGASTTVFQDGEQNKET